MTQLGERQAGRSVFKCIIRTRGVVEEKWAFLVEVMPRRVVISQREWGEIDDDEEEESRDKSIVDIS
jgi:hypothetical protein